MVGFLDQDIYKHRKEQEEKKNLYLEYIGEKVELSVRNSGKLEGKVNKIIGSKLSLNVGIGKKPVLVDIDDISLLNPLD